MLGQQISNCREDRIKGRIGEEKLKVRDDYLLLMNICFLQIKLNEH